MTASLKCFRREHADSAKCPDTVRATHLALAIPLPGHCQGGLRAVTRAARGYWGLLGGY